MRKNYEDHFEDVYLRHEYITRCKKLDGRFVDEYAPIVNTTARLMYEKLYPNFNKVGFDLDDIVSITNVYMLSYMGLYSLRFNKKARDKYILKYRNYKDRNGRKPTEKEIYAKDKNNLINFLRQRLQHCQTVCARKARNITVGEDRRGYYAFTKDAVAAANESIIENHKKFGYRKLTLKEYKECKEKAKQLGDSVVTDKDGFKVLDIQILNAGIGYKDYTEIIQSHASKFTMDPEEMFIDAEDEVQAAGFKKRFQSMTPTVRRKTLKSFIAGNKDNKYMKEELSYARKILRNPKIMV